MLGLPLFLTVHNMISKVVEGGEKGGGCLMKLKPKIPCMWEKYGISWKLIPGGLTEFIIKTRKHTPLMLQ